MSVTLSRSLSSGEPVFSFEFFPPKTDAGYGGLLRTIEELKPLSPGFVSVTMGAAGSTRSRTVDLVIQIQRDLGITTMAHLPCVGFEKSEIASLLDQLESAGIRNVLALRGDAPREAADFVQPRDGFRFASELVAFIHARGGFSVGGACYPEVHPQAASAKDDLRNLCKKVSAGADFLISQLFFDNQKFFDFEWRATGAGIAVPIVPGIMPITSAAGVRRMLALGGGSLPPELESELARVADDDEATQELGVRWATRQCRELLDHGVPGIHFYTLNRSPATRRIYRSLFPDRS
jgi:methylenetetrahydrofolate reductase (NADPH)